MPRITCPLCDTPASPFHEDAHGADWRCPQCELLFRDPSQRLTPAEQLVRYREHRNSIDDPRYLEFLARLVDPVAARLAPGARGLDFGCGPVPALAFLMARHGFATESYDPHFLPDESVLADRYDFITCSEVIEHVPDPAATLVRLRDMLRPGGLLGVMTQFPDPARPFANWWYRRDPTHVCFYSEATMRWIAAHFGWRVEFAPQCVTLFHEDRL